MTVDVHRARTPPTIRLFGLVTGAELEAAALSLIGAIEKEIDEYAFDQYLDLMGG